MIVTFLRRFNNRLLYHIFQKKKLESEMIDWGKTERKEAQYLCRKLCLDGVEHEVKKA